ncbi:MAG: hypothetical protein R3F10_03510 [Lysobacteraceae bacterium]
MNAIVDPFREKDEPAAPRVRRPIVDPWAVPQAASTTTKPRPAIKDPWASSGPVAVPAPAPEPEPEQPKTGLRRVLDVARSVSPGAMIADSTQTGRDFNSLIGGGVVAGTGRAVEGIERSIHSAFADRPQSRVRFLDDAGNDVTPEPIKQKFAAEDRAQALKESQWKPSGFSQALKNTGEAIQNEDISPRMKAAMENTQLDGDVFDPSSWSLGQDPSVRGLLGHVAKTGGEMASIVALGAIPVAGTGLATTAAAGQSASAAYDDAAGYIRNLPPDELAKLPQFQKLVGEGGLSAAEARETLAHRAGSGAMGPAAAVGALSGPILGGAVTKPLSGLAEKALGAGVGARVATGAAESLLEGAQEAGETIASRAGANQAVGTDRSTTEGTFGDFALGALASGPSSALHVVAGSEGRSDSTPSRPETLADVIARQQAQGELLALPPPEPIAVDANGNAATWEQQREREALGLTPDVQRVQARNNARPAIRDPWANPELAAPTLPDGSPLPDPNNGPASRTVNMGAQNGAIPTMSGRTWERDLANVTMDATAARDARQKERELDAIQRESRLPVALEDAEAADRIRAARGADQDVPTAMSVAFQQARERQAQVPFPDAAPGSMADVANTLPSRVGLDSTGLIFSQSQAVPGSQGADLRLASESSTSALPRSEIAAVTPENGVRQPVDSGELLQNAGIAAAPVAPGEGRITSAPPASSATPKQNRPAIRDQWAADVSNTTPEVNTSSAMRSQNAEIGTRPAVVAIEPLGDKRLALRGDAAQVRARLKAAGFKGRIWQHPDGFLHVDRKYRDQVEQVFGQFAPVADQTRENPAFAEQNRQVAGSAGAAHLEPGQPPQPATPAVVAESAQAVQRAPNVTMAQAKKTLLGQIDTALANANADAWPDMPEGTSMAARVRRQAAENERDRITQTAGYVTLDVPGDGTFRVVNNRSRLEAFRAQVERQFKNTQPPRGPQLPSLKPSDAERARIMSEAEQVDDALFSRASVVQGQPTRKGLPVANVERIAQDFMRRYRGNIPLDVKVGRTLEHLYGPNAAKLGNAKGAYHARTRLLTLAADRLSSRTDVETTLRHEVLGHYGLNTLLPGDKRAVLDAILTSRNRRDLVDVWKQVDTLYSDMPESIRAEEVFAELASRERGTLGEWWDKALALLAQGLRKVGLLRSSTTKAELHDLARRIAEGIRSGERRQQTFPQNDQSQFSRDASKTPSGVGVLSENELEVLRQLGLLSPEQESDLSGQTRGNTDDQPSNRWGERLIPDAEASTHLRAGARGTQTAVAGRTDVAVRGAGSAAGRAGEHLQLPDGAAEQSSAGLRGHPDDERAASGLLGLVRRQSESASDQLGGVPTAARHLDSAVGPFTSAQIRARIKNAGTPQEALVVGVYGREQIAAGLDEEPALTWTVKRSTGELEVNGPNPEGATFREFEKRGWAEHARGQDGENAVGWTALRTKDGSATLPMRQIIPMLADVHARYRALRKEDRVHLHWSRMTGATGGIAGRESSVFFSRANPFAEENRRLREQDQSLWTRAGKVLRREFAPGGLLPSDVFDEKIKRDSNFQAVEFDVRHLVGTLEDAVKADYGKRFDKLSDADKAKLAEALAGRVDPNIKESTRLALVTMRRYLDALSGGYMDIIQGRIDALMAQSEASDTDAAPASKDAELYDTIKGNLGQYVHRSYRAFDDPHWFRKVPDGVLNAARRTCARATRNRVQMLPRRPVWPKWPCMKYSRTARPTIRWNRSSPRASWVRRT